MTLLPCLYLIPLCYRYTPYLVTYRHPFQHPQVHTKNQVLCRSLFVCFFEFRLFWFILLVYMVIDYHQKSSFVLYSFTWQQSMKAKLSHPRHDGRFIHSGQKRATRTVGEPQISSRKKIKKSQTTEIPLKQHKSQITGPDNPT